MIFRQLVHDDLGCASYLIGDEDAGVAAVVDPRLDIDEYLRLARFLGVRIEHILETHNHADHVSGHGRLAAATGATIHVHREAAPDYDHEPFDDGWELELGRITVRALHTPGHRPEHTAFALIDLRRGASSLGQCSAATACSWATSHVRTWRSTRRRARAASSTRCTTSCSPLPDTTRGLARPSRRLDVRRARHGPEGVVDDRVRARQPAAPPGARTRTTSCGRPPPASAPQPPNFKNIVALNRGPLAVEAVDVHPLTPRQVEQAEADGALVVDVRTELQFDEAHIPSAICITALRGGFGTRLAWLAEPGQPLVLVGRDDEDAREAAELAGAVGLTNIAGYLAGGMTSWREEKRPVERVPRLSVEELHERWNGGSNGLQLLDVRERSEWDAGHIPGSIHTAYHDIHELPDGLDAGQPVAVICASGQRAAIAASLLKRLGAADVIHVVDGGVPRWKREGWPIER